MKKEEEKKERSKVYSSWENHGIEKYTILKTTEIGTEWVNKDGLIRRFEGLNRNTLSMWLMEMRNSNDFCMFVVNPSHKLVWINIDGFLSFLKWKSHQRGY